MKIPSPPFWSPDPPSTSSSGAGAAPDPHPLPTSEATANRHTMSFVNFIAVLLVFLLAPLLPRIPRIFSGTWSQTLDERDDLPAHELWQRRPRWHSLCQISVLQQPEYFAVRRVLHPVAPQTGPFPVPECVFSMTLCAVVVKHSLPGRYRVCLSRHRIQPFPVRVRHVLQPTPVRGKARHSRKQDRRDCSHLCSPYSHRLLPSGI